MVLCVTLNCKNCKIPVNQCLERVNYAGVSFYIKKTIYIMSRVAGLLACRFRPCFGFFVTFGAGLK